MSGDDDRCADALEHRARVRRVTGQIVPFGRAIRKAAAAKIHEIARESAMVEALDHVVPHAPRADPAVQEKHVPPAAADALHAELHAAVSYEGQHARSFPARWV